MQSIIGMLWDVWLVEFRRCMRERPAACSHVSTLWWEIWWLERFLNEPGPLPTPFGHEGEDHIVAPMFHPEELRSEDLVERMRAQQLLLTQLVATSLDSPWPQPNSVISDVGDAGVRREVTEAFKERLEKALAAVHKELEDN